MKHAKTPGHTPVINTPWHELTAREMEAFKFGIIAGLLIAAAVGILGVFTFVVLAAAGIL